ncbi:MAG: PEP-CTERM sorting domain-containing protein [Verrucomicrobia bacterium]|nr:PEP-CTERM sorting domain-containing protein [Verrucomicrobiota bacterium]
MVALVAAVSAMGATGWYSDYILVSINGGADGYYWIGSDPGFGTDFQGAYFGSLTTLEFGSDMRYWSDTQDRDGGAFYWSINWNPSANEVIWTQTYLGGNDYQGTTPSDVNVASGLGLGEHTVSVWAKSWGTGQGDSWLGTGSGQYAAMFTKTIPEPTTLVLVGLGVAGLLVYRRRR